MSHGLLQEVVGYFDEDDSDQDEKDSLIFTVACISANVNVSHSQRHKYSIKKGLAYQHRDRAKEIIKVVLKYESDDYIDKFYKEGER